MRCTVLHKSISSVKQRMFHGLIPGAILLLLATFLFLQQFKSFHLYYIEQFQLFLTTTRFFESFLTRAGGLVEYLSRFFVQFFIIPGIGPFLVALFLVLVFYWSYRLLIRLGYPGFLFIFPASVYLCCLFLCFDFNFYLQGILSYILFLCALDIFTSIKGSLKKK